MTLDSKDFKTFFEVAYDVTEISTLKCFKCGQSLTELSDQSGLTCINSHVIGYLEYMTQYSNMLKDFFDNGEISINFEKQVIKPFTVMYCGNSVVFIGEEILRK